MPIPIGRCRGLGKIVESALQKKVLINSNDPSFVQQVVNKLRPFFNQGHKITPFDVKKAVNEVNPAMSETITDQAIQDILKQVTSGPTPAEQAFEAMGGDEALRRLEREYGPQYPKT